MDKTASVTLQSGNTMPAVGLGTWGLTTNTTEIVALALELGYPMIDTSGDYGTQPGIGQGIKQSGVHRDAFYLITKIEETDDAYYATEKNLSEIDLEYADLVLIHRPPRDGVGEELWDELILAKQQGLTKDIGVSNYSIEQIEALRDATGEMPVVNQIEWSPFGYSDEMFRYCRENNIIIQAYSPLTHAERLDDPALRSIAKKYRKSPAQILIRWNIQKGVVPIVKASQEQHLTENLDVFDFELDQDSMKQLDDLNHFYSALGSLPYA